MRRQHHRSVLGRVGGDPARLDIRKKGPWCDKGLLLGPFLLSVLLVSTGDLSALGRLYPSHELRTPLTSIMGFLDLLLDRSGLDPSATTQLEIVRRNTDRLFRLVDDLLTIAETDQGGLVLTSVGTDLSDLVGEALGDIAPTAAAASRARVQPGIELVVDPVRIRQMIDNLLSNAVKCTSAGGLVTVSLVDEDDSVVRRVADTGLGIAQADLDNLFTRPGNEPDDAPRHSGHLLTGRMSGWRSTATRRSCSAPRSWVRPTGSSRC